MRFSTRISPKLAILLAVLFAVGGLVFVSRAGDAPVASVKPAAKPAARPAAAQPAPPQAAAPGVALPQR
jgi:hypothetical protein